MAKRKTQQKKRGPKTVRVKGYTKKDGTKVHGYDKSKPKRK